MSDDKEPKNDNSMEDLIKTVTTKVDSSINEAISGLENKLNAKKETEKKPDDDFKFSWEDEEKDDDEKPLTTNDLKDVLGKFSKAIEKKTDESITKKIITSNEAQDKIKKMWAEDQGRAEKDFPELKDASSEFYKETLKEIEAAKKRNPGAENTDPDMVYNSASRAMVKLQSKGQYVPKYLKDKMQESQPSDYSSFFVKPKASGSKELTTGQKKFAAVVGLSPERVAELQNKYRK